jgi:hypothetical protein
MKRPWQFGLFALALTGVATYDVIFFKNYNSNPPTTIQSEAMPTEVATVTAPSLGIEAPEQEGLSSLPPISREELQRKAIHEFAPKESPASEAAPWPSRDPFSMYQSPEPAKSDFKKPDPSTNQKSASANVSEPECIFSGTLIDRERRLALINGIPLSLGAQIGAWQLARIESDHIILQSEGKTRRIEFTDVGRQVLRKEPL